MDAGNFYSVSERKTWYVWAKNEKEAIKKVQKSLGCTWTAIEVGEA